MGKAASGSSLESSSFKAFLRKHELRTLNDRGGEDRPRSTIVFVCALKIKESKLANEPAHKEMECRGEWGTLDVPATEIGKRLILDLGNVRDVAEVMVNGKHAATLLLRPYQADISSFVQAGENSLEIAVTTRCSIPWCCVSRGPFDRARPKIRQG